MHRATAWLGQVPLETGFMFLVFPEELTNFML